MLAAIIKYRGDGAVLGLLNKLERKKGKTWDTDLSTMENTQRKDLRSHSSTPSAVGQGQGLLPTGLLVFPRTAGNSAAPMNEDLTPSCTYIFQYQKSKANVVFCFTSPPFLHSHPNTKCRLESLTFRKVTTP